MHSWRTISILLFLTFFSCHSNDSTLTGGAPGGPWVRTVTATSYNIPAPNVTTFKPNGTVEAHYFDTIHLNKYSSFKGRLQVDTNTFYIDTFNKKVLYIRHEEDTTFQRDYHYMKAEKVQLALPVRDVLKQLKSRTWVLQSKPSTFVVEKRLSFSDTNMKIIRTYQYQSREVGRPEMETACYIIKEVSGGVFIFIKNGLSLCENFVQVYQIASCSTEKLELISYCEREIDGSNKVIKRSMVFLSEKKTSSETPCIEFQPCYDFYNAAISHRSLIYDDLGEYALNHYFKSKYICASDEENGLITIFFTITCKSVIGRLNIVQLDENYSPVVFSHEVVSQLIRLTQQLEGWKNMSKLSNGPLYDFRKPLNFRFEKGKLKDVFYANI